MMTRIAFCVALYEAGRPFLPAFMAGVRAAARGHDACLVAAVDDLAAPRASLAELDGDLPLRFAACAPGSSPAAVRRTMLTEGLRSGADVLILADMDDMLLANAPGNHIAALEEADFSYGDLSLMDAAGHGMGRRFFDRADVPWKVASVDAVRHRNFLGLSNTALRADRIPASALQVPDDIVAVDWWLFTSLLLAGCRGTRTVAPVAHYRVGEFSLLGANAPATPEALRRTYRTMQRHYRAFRAAPGMAACLAGIEDRMAQIETLPAGFVASRLATLRERSGVWYEGLDAIEFAAPRAALNLA